MADENSFQQFDPIRFFQYYSLPLEFKIIILVGTGLKFLL